MAKLQEAGNRVLETDYIKIHGNWGQSQILCKVHFGCE